MKLLAVNCLLCFLFLLVSCEREPVNPVIGKGYLEPEYHGTQLIYTDLPIRFSFNAPTLYSPQEQLVWSFGDGAIENTPGYVWTHIYSEPGVYNITLRYKDWVLADTTFEVVPKPPTIEALTGEDILLFRQDENSDYVVVYVNEGSHNYHFLAVTTDQFEKKKNELLTANNIWNFYAAAKSKNGGVLLVGPRRALEINLQSTVVKDNIFSPDYYFEPSGVIQTETGYKIVGESSGRVFFSEIDESLQTKTLKEIKALNSSNTIWNMCFENPEKIRIQHSSPNSEMTLLTLNLEGDVLREKTYPRDQVMSSFKFSGGYVLFAREDSLYTSSRIFRLTDEDGKIFATKKIEEWVGLPDGNDMELEADAQFIEHNDFLYFFFGHMQVLKLKKNGDVVWLKHFSTGNDAIRSVTLNNQGNFVLLGDHFYDPETKEFTEPWGVRYLMFIEIDENGNYIYQR